jgi:predicted porin
VYDIHKSELNNGNNGLDYRDWFVSASAPYGNFLFKATYGRVTDKRNATEMGAATALQGDSSKFGIGVNYYLSKRTNIYADYARIYNRDSNSNYTITASANSQAGYGTDGFNIGLAHNF